MNRVISRSTRRIGVTVNYASLAMFTILFLIGEYGYWSTALMFAASISAIVLITSFLHLHIRTRLWHLVHANTEELDEREVQVSHDSFRRSYTIFSIVSLIVIIFITLSVRFSFFTLTHRGHYSFGLIMLLALNYLIHTLPASIIAWSEKEVLVR